MINCRIAHVSVVLTHSASFLARTAADSGSWRCLRKCLLFVDISFPSSTVAGLLLIPDREKLAASSSRLRPSLSPPPLHPSRQRNSATASARNPLSYTTGEWNKLSWQYYENCDFSITWPALKKWVAFLVVISGLKERRKKNCLNEMPPPTIHNVLHS